jgi:hypothetical protein
MNTYSALQGTDAELFLLIIKFRLRKQEGMISWIFSIIYTELLLLIFKYTL